MPAMIAHYLFAQRVFSKLKKAGVEPEDRDMAVVGAQGPDLFFFHRVLPWEPGPASPNRGACCTRSARPNCLRPFVRGSTTLRRRTAPP